MPVNKLKSKLSKLSCGFTLIELLVVISIIAILFATASYSYLDIQRKSRDSRRKADLVAVLQALEQFKNVNGAYPDEDSNSYSSPYVAGASYNDRISCTTNGNNNYSTNFGKLWQCNTNSPPSDPSIAQTYIKLPTDPIQNDSLSNQIGPDGIAHDCLGPCNRYMYEIYEHNTGDGSPAQGWCPFQNGTNYGHCQKYTLWAHLENPNDSDIAKTASDPICQLAITYELSGEFDDWAAPVTSTGLASVYGTHKSGGGGSPNNKNFHGWANYCVHN